MRARRARDAVTAFRSVGLPLRRRAAGRLQGDHAGHRLGPGTAPEEVVRYRPGEDDVRWIDWNVTARSTELHVWRTRADHELSTWVLLDETASMDFGSDLLEKTDVALGAVAAVAALVAAPGNRLGVLHLGADGLRWSRPVPAAAAARRAVRADVGALERELRVGAGSAGLAEAIETLGRRHPRPGLRVLVSDFVEPDGRTERPFPWERALRRLAARHEVLVIEVVDPRDLELPDVGPMVVVDPETGHRCEVWTSLPGLRERYAAVAAEHRAEIAAAVRVAGAAHVVLRTNRDWVRDLTRHVSARRRAPVRRTKRGTRR